MDKEKSENKLETAGISRIIKKHDECMVRIAPDVHSDLKRIAGYLQWKTGETVSINAAIRHLINKCGELENQSK
jgi:hypothetical protein